MCLILGPNAKLKIAKKDITCYKIVCEFEPGVLRTPYMHFPVAIGETYTSVLEDAGVAIDYGLHSFKSLHNTIREADFIRRSVTTHIVKCIIPAGSNYFVGKYGAYISYASDKLTYLEIIK